MRVHIEVFGKCLDKGSASRRTGFVEHDGVDNAVSDLHALHVLTADVDDEIHIRAEILRGLEVSHRLDLAEIDTQRGADDVLAVTGHAAVRDIGLRRHLLIELLNDIDSALNRIALVTGIVGIDHLSFFVDKNRLRSRTSGIDTKVARALLLRKLIKVKCRTLMSLVEKLLFTFISKERSDSLDIRLESFS